jgi:hypothetical protein
VGDHDLPAAPNEETAPQQLDGVLAVVPVAAQNSSKIQLFWSRLDR